MKRLKLRLSVVLATAAVAGVSALAWVRPSLVAAPPPGAFGGGGQEVAPSPAPRLYFQSPVTAEAAKVWIKLQQKVPMKFANETPLADVLKSIQVATKDKDMPEGLTIYVDPVGLQEAEKTIASPIVLDLEGIPLKKTLTLILGQLGLVYSVDADGLLTITSASDEAHEKLDPTAAILDRLKVLELEIQRLHVDLSARRGVGGPVAGSVASGTR